MAIKVGKNRFAVPADHILGIVEGKQNMPCTILPNESENIKCTIELIDRLVTVVNVPGTCEDAPILDNLIVVVEHFSKYIGILANESNLVKISTNEICENKVTDTKTFMHNGKIYLIMDISQLCKELGIMR